MSCNEIVLITGATSGIGYELAKKFAFNKYDLILVSRNADKLARLANELSEKYNIMTYIIAQDLSQQGAARTIFNTIARMNLQVDVLINNAGSGKVGFFHEIEMERDLEILQLNIVSLTEMTKLFSREMVKRNKGRILNVASTGAFAPGPFTAVYYATKAYVLSFSEALYKELQPYKISVTTLCPGATRTNFSKNAGKKDVPGGMEPEKVAKAAYYGLMKNKRLVVPGFANKILIKLPSSLVSSLNFKMQRKLAFKEEKE